jgi:hypothetical protein
VADKFLSTINLGGTTYLLKDKSARDRLDTVETTLASGLIFKGTVSSAAGITGLTDYKIGWTYKASASFSITNIGSIESGDMIICVSAYSSSYKATDWTVVQNNVDIFTGASASAAGTRGLVPQPSAGSQSKFLRGDATWGSIDSVPKLTTARTITVDGDESGSASFDGSADITINLTDNRYVTGTQTAATSAWTGALHGVKSLYNGLCINYWLPYAAVSGTNVTLNLTLDDGTTTGAIDCYR